MLFHVSNCGYKSKFEHDFLSIYSTSKLRDDIQVFDDETEDNDTQQENKLTKKKGGKKGKSVVSEITMEMTPTKPKKGQQTTLQIDQGSSKLTVKMPFNKSTSSSDGNDSTSSHKR